LVRNPEGPYYFIYDHEVSNRDYNEFLSSLLIQKKYELYSKVIPDSTKWIFGDKLSFKTYYNSKKYSNYPVVCVSYDGALAYCKWQQELINQSAKDSRIAVVRLPTNLEWMNSIYFMNQGAVYASNLKDKLMNEKNAIFLILKMNHKIT
jgi:formylglycine-generating enzyme required for sulfatase activity